MTALAPLAVSLWALGAGAIGVEAEVGAASRVRQIAIEDRTAIEVAELEAVPRLALRHEGSLHAVVAYAPQLLLPFDLRSAAAREAGGDVVSERLQVLHRAEILVDDSVARDLTLRLRGDGSLGETDLLRAGAWTGLPVATAARIQLFSARAAAGVAASPSRRITFSLDAGAFARGGADAATRTTLPLEKGLLADAALAWNATRRDVLSSVATGTLSRFTPSSTEAAFLRVGGLWLHEALRTLALRAGLGAVGASSRAPAGDADRRAAPWAEVGLSHAPEGPRPSEEIALRLDSAIDPNTGRIDRRMEAHAAVTWRAARDWTLASQAVVAAVRAASGGLDLRWGEVPTILGSIDLRASWALGERATVSCGAWRRWQRSTGEGLPSFGEWGGLLEVSLGARWPERAPPIRVPPAEPPGTGTVSRSHGG